MRLSNDQCAAIFEVANSFNAKAMLYGSRSKDNLKGGDIDLLFIVENKSVKDASKNHLNILNLLKKDKRIGDRRIDLKICTSKDLDSDPFLKTIKADLTEIKA